MVEKTVHTKDTTRKNNILKKSECIVQMADPNSIAEVVNMHFMQQSTFTQAIDQYSASNTNLQELISYNPNIKNESQFNKNYEIPKKYVILEQKNSISPKEKNSKVSVIVQTKQDIQDLYEFIKSNFNKVHKYPIKDIKFTNDLKLAFQEDNSYIYSLFESLKTLKAPTIKLSNKGINILGIETVIEDFTFNFDNKDTLKITGDVLGLIFPLLGMGINAVDDTIHGHYLQATENAAIGIGFMVTISIFPELLPAFFIVGLFFAIYHIYNSSKERKKLFHNISDQIEKLFFEFKDKETQIQKKETNIHAITKSIINTNLKKVNVFLNLYTNLLLKKLKFDLEKSNFSAETKNHKIHYYHTKMNHAKHNMLEQLRQIIFIILDKNIVKPFKTQINNVKNQYTTIVT